MSQVWLGQELVKKGSRKERREEQSGPGEEAGCDKGKEQGLWGLPGRQLGWSRAQGSVHHEAGEVACGQGQTLQAPISQVKDLILSQEC